MAKFTKKKTVLDSLISATKDKALKISYTSYKRLCKNIYKADSTLIGKREDFIERLNNLILQDSFYLDDKQYILYSISNDLDSLYIRLHCMEGNCLGVCRVKFPGIWKEKCNCPESVLYSDIIALNDANSDSEYPYYCLSERFQLMAKADTFLIFYPTHFYAKKVQELYFNYLQRLSDTHMVLNIRDKNDTIRKEIFDLESGEMIIEPDTLVSYVMDGLDLSQWPFGFFANNYRELLEEYPGRYSKILHSSIDGMSAIVEGRDTIFVCIKKLGQNSLKSPDFEVSHHIHFEEPQFKDYSVLKFHYDREELKKISKNILGGEIYRAVRVNESLARIVE